MTPISIEHPPSDNDIDVNDQQPIVTGRRIGLKDH
jgi:hypothetical protein